MKKRIEAAVEKKVEGEEISVSPEPEKGGAQIIDLMAALRESLNKAPKNPTRTCGAPRNACEDRRAQAREARHHRAARPRAKAGSTSKDA